MENEKNEQINYIDLRVLWRRALSCARRLWPVLLVLMLLGGGLMYLRARRSYYPLYRSEAVFSVTVNTSGSSGLMGYSYYYDNSAAQQAVDTFPYLMESDLMQELIRQELGTSFINGGVSASAVGGTNFFVLTATSSRPEDAQNILKAIIKVYPQVSSKVNGDTQLVINTEPLLPQEPYNHFAWHKQVAIGVLAGLALGALVILLAALRRHTVLNTKDVQREMNLPCLAHIPEIRLKKRTNQTAGSLLLPQQRADSPFSEAFRLLRLRLSRRLSEEDKVLLVTSTLPSEGKSSVSVNTALSLAKDEKKVLLVDADLRSPTIKSLLELDKPSKGLAEYLSGQTRVPHFLRYGGTSLYVFAGDEALPNPSAVLRQQKLSKLMDYLRENFDYIVIDTPPCRMMSDAEALCTCADKVLYVIRRDYADLRQISDSVRMLSGNGANVCGYVLNRAEHSHGSHYGYGYGYGKYGYGKYDYGKYGKYGRAGEDESSNS